MWADFSTIIKDISPEDFPECKSVEDIYTTTEEIQKMQAADGTLCALNRIEPYLDRLREYAAVIRAFAEVKPEMMFLIWVCKPIVGDRNGYSLTRY